MARAVEQGRDPLASVPSPEHAAAARQDMDIADLTGCGIQFLVLIPHADKCALAHLSLPGALALLTWGMMGS